MTGVKTKIKLISRNLTRAEKKVAEYILENAEDVPFLSVHAVADAVEVSVASVSRLVRKIGYPNFKIFKIELAKDTTFAIPEIYGAITPEDTDEVIMQKIFEGYVCSIKETLKILHRAGFIKVSKIISRTKRVVFFGIGSSANVAKEAALRLSHLDIQVEAYTEPLSIIVQAMRLKKGEVAFGISHSGRSRIICEALRIAKERNAVTVGISNYMKSPLNDYAQYLFYTSFPENRVKAAAISSRIAQLCLIDTLYLLVAKHKETMWDVESLNALVEKLLRLKG